MHCWDCPTAKYLDIAAELREVLLEIEFCNAGRCPYCDEHNHHAPGCRLNKALSR